MSVEDHRLAVFLAALVVEQQRRRTTAGIPPGYHQPKAWRNVTSVPPSADDPDAPPLNRRLM